MISAALDCRNRIDHAQAAILVPMPIQANVFALFVNDAAHKFHYFPRAVGGRMPNRVADANRARAAANSGRIKRANRFGLGARCIFGDEHHGQAFTDCKGHRFIG